MAQEKLTLEEILANPDERIKLLVEIIDDFVKSKAKRKNILKAIEYGFDTEDEEILRYAKAYLSYKMPADDEDDEDN